MEVVGGYRLVRKLAEGSRATLFLGHAGEMLVENKPAGSAKRVSSIAVLKIYRPTTSLASIDQEISALESVSTGHIMAIRDVTTGEDGRPCLILPRLSSLSLGRLLAIRSSVSAGEASTLLVPLCESVSLLHSSGVAHGALRPDAVLFDDRGAPVLGRFGQAKLFSGGETPSLARLDQELSVIDDRISLRIMLASVVARIVTDYPSPAVAEFRRWLADGLAVEKSDAAGSTFTHEHLAFLAQLIFDFAAPRAIHFRDPPAQVETPANETQQYGMKRHAIGDITGGLASSSDRESELPCGSAQQNTAKPAPGDHLSWWRRMPIAQLRSALNLPAWLESAVANTAERVTAARPASVAKKVLSPVRRSVWAVGGVGVLAIILAFAAMPGTRSESKEDSKPERAYLGDNAASGSRPDTAPSAARPASGEAATSLSEHLAAVAGEDPLSAATALIALRHECLATRDISCLAGADQVGSAFHEADIHLIGRLAAGTALSPKSSLAGQLTLVQQLGNSAILNLLPLSDTTQKNPVPLLLVRSETGWRIRDADFG